MRIPPEISMSQDKQLTLYVPSTKTVTTFTKINILEYKHNWSN